MPIINATRQSIVASCFDIASNPLTRMKGLIGRAQMPQDWALVIRPCSSIHMMFMRFAIDVIFVDDQNKVVGLVKAIKPFCISPVFWDSAYAVELAAGTIQATRTNLGDSIEILNSKHSG